MMAWPDLGPRYSSTRWLGSGAHGQVWQCQDHLASSSSSSRPVAVKVSRTDRPRELRGLERELAASVQLRDSSRGALCKHLVVPHDCVISPPHAGLVQELACGQPLDKCGLKKAAGKARMVCGQLVAALSFCHDHGIAHMDVKPANMMLLHHDDCCQLALFDFGLSGCLHEDGRGLVGTLGFVPPEVLANGLSRWTRAYARGPVDVWAVGAVLHLLLFGRLPFGAEEAMTNHHPAGVAEEDRAKLLGTLMQGSSTASWRVAAAAADQADPEAAGLLDCMLAPDPVHRPSMRWLASHPWLLQPCTEAAAAAAAEPEAALGGGTVLAQLREALGRARALQLQKGLVTSRRW